MTMAAGKHKREDKGLGLVDLVFSWSIQDIMNAHLYANQVSPIPATFHSANQYLQSFISPLAEETHADLRSNFMTLGRAPACQVLDIKKQKRFENPKMLLYKIWLKPGFYEPEFGDLMALTEVKPKRIDDLNGPKRSYLIALVQGKNEDSNFIKIKILSSKPIEFERANPEMGKQGDRVYVVYLTNLTTNMRIWRALHPDLDGGNKKMISSLLSVNPSLAGNCDTCFSKETGSLITLDTKKALDSIGLDDSQKEAVLSCLAIAKCHHLNRVKLIWGPPGTGKTKTISSLVLCLLRMQCRTLTCAPTNVAVLGVAKRLMSLLRGTLKCKTYGLGDIVLFGNGERMKVDDHEDVHDIFLDYRVEALTHCFAPLTGWKGSLQSMIGLLEDPEAQYLQYKEREMEISKDGSDDDAEGEDVEVEKNEKESRTRKETTQHNLSSKSWKELINLELKKAKKKNSKEKIKSKREGTDVSKKDKTELILLTFEEFFAKRFMEIEHQLFLCITRLCTHMPPSLLPFGVVKNMAELLDMLQNFQSLINRFEACSGSLRNVLKDNEQIRVIITECLDKLKNLSLTYSVPNFFMHHQITSFCLKNACLIFCTASSSAKLHAEGMSPIQMVIIDEAAQLKECESSIPLQLPGIRHAILVGDEKQLPAMVQSKMCMKSNFGRSLFERLVDLGHSKHLLDVQYRMHPSISLFPSTEFYGNQIKDGRNVAESSYKRSYLGGSIFGSFSFIDVTNGKEDFDDKHSRKNMVEVSVLAEILSKLHKESVASNQKLRVGCISPYKAQVSAIEERLGKTYSRDAKDKFSVNVRSVDGFQGGEEDVIIISTVRCNGNGSVGFLSNCQRANVALTRAKFCLWILGNGATLLNSHSVWTKLVLDAKRRGCFYNADEDKSLALAISRASFEHGQLNALFDTNSLLFKTSKWKVCFSTEFQDSVKKFEKLGIHKEVIFVLEKLSNGWLQTQEYEAMSKMKGTSAQLMKLCEVKGPLKLIWTTDLLQEGSKETQVLKIWDVLRLDELPKLAKKLDVLLGNYSQNQISRCLSKRIEGELTLPKTWTLDGIDGSSKSALDLPRRLSAMSLMDEKESQE